MMQRVKVVIPVYNEFENVIKLIYNIKNYLFMYNYDIGFTIVDDTKNDSIIDMIFNSGISNKIRYIRGNGNYGDSLITGMLRTQDYDKLIIMDIDHPFDLIPDIVHLLDANDIVIGNDLNINIQRKVTKLILRWQLSIKDIPHPTCGLMGFNKDVLGYGIKTDKTIRFYRALSNRDIVHVEFLYMCIKKKLMISCIDFDTSKTNIKHNYNFKRNIIWLFDLLRVVSEDIVFDWYQ